MREINIEISLLGLPFRDEAARRFLDGLLRCADLTYLLRIRSEGFLMICRVASRPYRDQLMAESFSDRVQIKVLSTDKTGDRVLQISGTWAQLFNLKNGEESKVLRFMRSVSKQSIYITKNATLQGDMIRFSLLGDEKAIAEILDEMKNLDIPFNVTRLGRAKTHKDSPLADLTERQAGILRLAYSLGYYEVPKRTRVEDIARILGIDKGTAGEHLQRAEKHVFDRLLK